jgi:putative mRNA 3-end processing factor
VILWNDALKLRDAELYLDSRVPRPFCFVSHAHSDHLGEHDRIVATPATMRLAEHRNVRARTLQAPFGQGFSIDHLHHGVLHPAGHVLGSAMLLVQGPDQSLLYTGDFKLRPSRTCETASPTRADVLLMESTYGRPEYRFPPPEKVAQELVERCAAALAAGRQPIALGYSLGKAQEIVRILTDAGLPVSAHGAVASLCAVYEELGVSLGCVRRYAWADFHGPRQLDLSERGVLVAPPSVSRTPFVENFDRPLSILLSGWAIDQATPYRAGVDVALPLSDHADFQELLDLIELVQPKKVFTHHGFVEFVDHLKMRGIDAQLARPEAQLRLFD